MMPDLKANEEPEEPLTKYGLMRRKYLKEHRSGIYAGLMLEGKLKEHCLLIQTLRSSLRKPQIWISRLK